MEDQTSFANRSKEEPAGQKQTVDCHTHEQYFACKLLKTLKNENAHHYLFQSIMEWVHDVAMAGYTFQPKQTTHKAHIQNLKSWLNLPASASKVSTHDTSHFT